MKAKGKMHHTPIKPDGKEVKKVLMYYSSIDGLLVGLDFFNKDGVMMMETKLKWDDVACRSHEIIL